MLVAEELAAEELAAEELVADELVAEELWADELVVPHWSSSPRSSGFPVNPTGVSSCAESLSATRTNMHSAASLRMMSCELRHCPISTALGIQIRQVDEDEHAAVGLCDGFWGSLRI